jgi:hypothetical protein
MTLYWKPSIQRKIAADICKARGRVAVLFDGGLSDRQPLARLITKYITEDFLGHVAQEYGNGRLLLILMPQASQPRCKGNP